jgi:tRNA G18 (ribose-2'-O)-methylase SpoU
VSGDRSPTASRQPDGDQPASSRGTPIDRFTEIRDADLRGREGLFCVESPRVVERFLHALVARARGAPCAPALGLEAILLTPDHAQRLASLIDAASALLPPFEVIPASHEQICATTGYTLHRGAVALGRRAGRGRVTEGSVDALAASGVRTVIACDRVVHVDNVGSLFRNAGSFGDAGILLGPGCGDALSRKAVRISSGRVFSVPWCETDSWDAAIATLRARHGFGFVACEDVPGAVTPAHAIAALHSRGVSRIAFVMGSEGAGLGSGLVSQCDAVACIPMRTPQAGPGNPVPLEAADRPSLNVAVASALVLHEACRANAHAGAAVR